MSGSAIQKTQFDLKHFIVMALGNIIGSGIFLASGEVISAAGPSALLAYAIGGLIMLLEVMFIAEMSIVNPAPGSFRVHAAEVFGPWLGFVNGWMFWCSGLLGMASEITAAAIFSRFWLPGIPLWIFCGFFALLMTLVNLLDVRGLSKIEALLASFKLITLIAFIIYGILALAGVLPSPGGRSTNASELIGNFLPNGLRGLASVLLIVQFSFTGTGIIGLAIAETEKPEKTVPKAIFTITGTVTGIYLASVTLLLLLAPWSKLSSSISPFSWILAHTGIPFAASIMNFILLTASLSGLNASMYSASRMLFSLGSAKQAPAAFIKLNNKGVPIYAVTVSSIVLLATALLSYLLPEKIFIILLGASSFTAMFNWLTISVTHIFYRRKVLREKPEKLKFRVPGYPITSIIAIALILLVLATTPINPDQLAGFIGGLALIVVLIFLYNVLKKAHVLQ